MKSSSGAENFQVLSLKIDKKIRRSEKGHSRFTHEEFLVDKRMPSILGTLAQHVHKVGIIQIQEARHFRRRDGSYVDSITPIVKFLSAAGFEVQTAPYNLSRKSFTYITAAKKKEFTFVYSKSHYLTRTKSWPQKSLAEEQEEEYAAAEGSPHTLKDVRAKWRERNGFDEWEKSAFETRWQQKSGSRKVLCCFNTHLGTPARHRMFASGKLAQLLNKSKHPTIMTGDFNSFDDWMGNEQMALLHQKCVEGVKECKGLVYEDTKLQSSTKSTFVCFPDDFAAASQCPTMSDLLKGMRPEIAPQNFKRLLEHAVVCGKMPDYPMGSQLDHVFYKGLTETRPLQLWPTWTDKAIEWNHIKLKQALLSSPQNPILATDHQILLGSFTVGGCTPMPPSSE